MSEPARPTDDAVHDLCRCDHEALERFCRDLERSERRLKHWFVTLLIVGVALLIVFLVAGGVHSAPAPLSRKAARPARHDPHRSQFWGDWVVRWHNQDFHYRFHPAGTFEHFHEPGRTDYSGTWAAGDDGTLVVLERDGTQFVYRYEFRPGGPGWKCRRHENSFLTRSPLPKD